MNIGVRVSFWIMVFFGYMTGSGIAGRYGSHYGEQYGGYLKH